MLPLPSGYFRKIFAVLVDVLGVLNKLVAHLLLEVSTSDSELRKILKCKMYKMETIHMVLNTYIERSGDGTFFFVSAYMHETVVVTSVSKLMYKGCISMESKYNGLVLGEEHIVLCILKSVRMLVSRLELEEVNYVDETDLDLGNLALKD